MTTSAAFGHQAAEPGERTDRSLAEVLGIDPSDLATELASRLEMIRETERQAERETAEVRLY